MKDKSAVILVFNKDNDLLLQLRSKNDDSYPSHWDFSAAGGIDEGEEPLESAKRELKEELGIESELGFYKEYDSQGDYLYVYKTTYEGEFELDSNEVDSVKYFNLKEIRDMIDRGEKFHPEFVEVFGIIPS